MIRKFTKTEIEARDFGFKWPNAEMIFDQISSELQEVRETISNDEGATRTQEEIGDLIATCMSLCIYLGFDIEETLSKLNEKFASRIDSLKRVAAARGLESLKGQSLEACLELWHEVKTLEKS